MRSESCALGNELLVDVDVIVENAAIEAQDGFDGGIFLGCEVVSIVELVAREQE